MIELQISDAEWNLILELLEEARKTATSYRRSLICEAIDDFKEAGK